MGLTGSGTALRDRLWPYPQCSQKKTFVWRVINWLYCFIWFHRGRADRTWFGEVNQESNFLCKNMVWCICLCAYQQINTISSCFWTFPQGQTTAMTLLLLLLWLLAGPQVCYAERRILRLPVVFLNKFPSCIRTIASKCFNMNHQRLDGRGRLGLDGLFLCLHLIWWHSFKNLQSEQAGAPRSHLTGKQKSERKEKRREMKGSKIFKKMEQWRQHQSVKLKAEKDEKKEMREKVA